MKKSQVRQQIMSTPEMAGMSAKLKDLKRDKAEKLAEASDYLIEYERLSGTNVIETLSGEQLTIFKTATAAKASDSFLLSGRCFVERSFLERRKEGIWSERNCVEASH